MTFTHLGRLGLAFMLLAGLLSPVFVSAQTVGEYRSDARKDCTNLQPKVNTIVADFSGTSKYSNVRAINPVLRAALAAQATVLKADLDAWCSAMRTTAFSSDTAARTEYNRLAGFRLRGVFLPLYTKIGELDRYYSRITSLKANYLAPYVAVDAPAAVPPASVSGLYKDYGDLVAFNNPDIIGTNTDADIVSAVVNIKTNIDRAEELAPGLADYTGIFAQSETEADISLETISTNLRAATGAITNGEQQYNRGRTIMKGKMARAALENITKTGKSAEYGKIYDTNRARVDSIKDKAVSEADRNLRSLDKLWIPAAPRVPASGLLTDGQTTYMNAGLRTNLRNRVENARTAVSGIRTALLPATIDAYYTEIQPQLTAADDLKLGFRVPALQAATTLHKLLTTLRGETAANSDAEDGLEDLFASMTNTTKRNPIEDALAEDPLVEEFDAAIDEINLAPLAVEQTALESEITQVINPTNSTASGFVSAASAEETDEDALADIHETLADYTRLLNAERSDILAARKIWLSMVTKAANSGAITDLAPYENDLQAKKILDTFDRSRASLKNKVAGIVESRKTAIDRNQLTIEEAEPNITNTGHRLDFSELAETVRSQLDTFQAEADAMSNYTDLKAKVLELKDMGVNTVFLPAQRLYLRAANYYARKDVLNQVNDLLLLRADALSTSSPERDSLIAEATDLQLRIEGIETSLGAAITGPLEDALTTRERVTAEDTDTALSLLDETKASLQSVSSELGALRDQINDLFDRIKDAESFAEAE